jgi:hypothetical protein
MNIGDSSAPPQEIDSREGLSPTRTMGVQAMYRRFVGIGMLAMFLSLVASSNGADDNKKKKGDPPPTTDSDSLAPGDFTGKLKSTINSDNSFIVSVMYQHLELKNPNALAQFQKANPQLKNLIRDQQRVAQLQSQLANTKNPKQAAKLLQQLQNEMNLLQAHQVQAAVSQANAPSPYVLKTDYKDITFHAAEDVKVRFDKPPAAFDEKGNVKKYTAEELKELKGKDTKLPGYEGSVEKLTVGMPVKITLVRRKAPPKDADKDKPKNPDADKAKDAEKPKDAEKAKDADKPTESKTVVNLILVLGDESSGTATSPGDKPKK